jgi:type VI secretion system protein ImpB
MSSENTQHRIDRVRKPRVHITYDVEVGGAMVKKELPFVVGVLGDFTGKPAKPLAPLRDRKFIKIDRDNFDGVLKRMKPRLVFSVDNKITGDNTELGVDITFKSIRSFNPDEVVNSVPALRSLAETRRRLSDLLTKVDGNEQLGKMLRNVVEDSGVQEMLSKELSKEMSADASLEEPAVEEEDEGEEDDNE